MEIGQTLAELAVKIKADTTGLKSGLNKAEGMIRRHHKAIGLAMTAAGGAILTAGALSIKTYAKMGDEVAKLARKTGFSTETLSELRHAAELSGTDLGGLEKATKRMSKSITDASEGMTTYQRAFDRIGLSVEDLIDLSPEEQFLAIGGAIARLENPTLRAATAQDIFGRAGMDLLPMFDQGIDALDEMRQEAHDLGIVFDQEAAKKSEDFTDALYRVDASMMGLKMAIADKLIPALTPLIETICNVITAITDWIDQHPQLMQVLGPFIFTLGGLLAALGPILIILPGLTAAAAALGVGLLPLIGIVAGVAVGIGALIAIGVLVWKNWDTIKEKAQEIWGGISQFFGNIWDKITGIFSEHWEKILAILFPPVGLAVLIARNWGQIVSTVQEIFSTVAKVLIDWWNAAKQWLAQMNPWEFAKQGWQGVSDGIRGMLSSAANILTSWWRALTQWLSGLNPWEWMKGAWENFRQGIKGILSKIFGGSDFEDWANGLKTYAQNFDLSDAAEGMFGSFRAGVKGQLDAITSDIDLAAMTWEERMRLPGKTGAPRTVAEELSYEEQLMKWEAERGQRVKALQEAGASLGEVLAAASTGMGYGIESRPYLKNVKTAADLRAAAYEAMNLRVAESYLTQAEIDKMVNKWIQDYRNTLTHYGVVPQFQSGGIVTAPTMGILGEAGPEAVIPLNKGLGGIVINFNEPVFMENEAAMHKLASKIREYLRQEERHLYGGVVA